MLRGLWLVGALLVSSSAGAQSSSNDVFVDKWRISQKIPGLCQAITRINEHLTFNAITEKAKDQTVLFFQSDLWRFPSAETHQGALSLDGWKTTQSLDFKTGAIGTDGILSVDVGQAFRDRLASSSEISIKVPDLYVGGDIPLGRVDGVLGALADCIKS